MLTWIETECDLSEYPKEVSDYVFDQLKDRLADSSEVMTIVEATEIETNYKTQTVQFTAVIPEVIQKIIEEKVADIDYERKHGERD